MTAARYDGQTEWYESFASADMFSNARTFAVQLLGPGRVDASILAAERAVRFPISRAPAGRL